MKTRFVIISVPRSGSNYLCGLLNSHPHILCHHEIFHRDEIYYALDHREGDIDLGSKQIRDRYPKKFIRAIWNNNLGCSSVGFKIFPRHHEKAMEFLLNTRKIKKIILVRDNQLKSYVSNLIARRTGIYAQHKHTSSVITNDKIEISIDLEDLNQYINSNNIFFESVQSQLNKSRQEFVKVTYEELVGDTKFQSQQRILNFIGFDNLNLLQETHKKQNSRPLSEIIVNYEQLSQSAKGTSLERFFGI